MIKEAIFIWFLFIYILHIPKIRISSGNLGLMYSNHRATRRYLTWHRAEFNSGLLPLGHKYHLTVQVLFFKIRDFCNLHWYISGIYIYITITIYVKNWRLNPQLITHLSIFKYINIWEKNIFILYLFPRSISVGLMRI